MIPWDLLFLAVNEAEKGNCGGGALAVYSNKEFLFVPAAWGSQNFCDGEQDFCRSLGLKSFASVTSILPHESNDSS
jgi:hypothetical protein